MVPQQDGNIRAADQFFVHGFADGLAPGATFHYRFRLADGTTTPDAVFTTAPARTALGAVHVHRVRRPGRERDPTPTADGFSDNSYEPDDTRRTAAPSDALVALIAARRPAFHLLAGDICYADPSGYGHPVKNNGAGSADNGFDNFDPTVWSQYFGVIEKSAATDALAVRHGQPRHGGALRRQPRPRRRDARLRGPRRPARPAAHRAERAAHRCTPWSTATSACSASTPTTCPPRSPPTRATASGAQLTWLTQRLTRAAGRPATSTSSWRSSTTAPTRPAPPTRSDAGVRAALAPLFDRFAVDLVVQGHNHQYERTDPIRGGVATREAPDGASVEAARDGTTYICCGSGGRPRYAWQPGETDSYRGAPDARRGPSPSYVAGRTGRKTPETVDVVTHPLPRLRLPLRARHARRTGRHRDDERAGGHRRRPGDRSGRPGARPAAGDPRVAAVGARSRGLTARRAHRLHVGQPADHGSGFGRASWEQELRAAQERGRDQADCDGHGAEHRSEVHHMYIYAAAIQVRHPIR